jgi:hypothetical protein
MRPFIGKDHKAVDSGMECLHLLKWSGVRFGILDETIHLNDKLSGREDGALRFNIQRPNLA